MLEDVIGVKRGNLDMVVITDSKSLEAADHTTSRTKDKRCNVDMAGLRQGIERKEFVVLWQEGAVMLADALTKKGANPELLRCVIENGECGLIIKKGQ